MAECRNRLQELQKRRAAVAHTKSVNELLDVLVDALKLKNDAALCRRMNVTPPVISKLRYGVIPFGPSYIITAHELTGWSIKQIKDKLGLPTLEQDQIAA